jgi:Alanine dehydrogenase/PNT, N-terminal domain
MEKYLGIRREDKNEWERRVPLIPEDIKELYEKHGIQTVVQPSTLRIYQDNAFTVPGAVVDEDLSKANTIFAVKEIPTNLLEANKTYLFFSHTIKGQPYNMDMLRRLMALKCNLIDYERIVNEKNQRLIFFGAHAGYAGIIETLFAYARKMKKNGIDSPLSRIRQAYEYASLDEAKDHVKEISDQIASEGLPKEMAPLVVGFAGYGNVSKGAQEIFDLLPFIEIKPNELADIRNMDTPDTKNVYKVVFKEENMVKPVSGDFDLQDYYDHPQKYESTMGISLPHLDILVNCIYWTPDYPRLVSKQYLKEQYNADTKSRLAVIGDISCDIEGSIEITKDATMPNNACFTYFPGTDSFENGITKRGITVMAIDNLPCEFSKEASIFFSNVLKGYADDVISTDFTQPFDQLPLPYPIKKALILHNGQLTDDYKYIEQYR